VEIADVDDLRLADALVSGIGLTPGLVTWRLLALSGHSRKCNILSAIGKEWTNHPGAKIQLMIGPICICGVWCA
jgi:hypothetical protein